MRLALLLVRPQTVVYASNSALGHYPIAQSAINVVAFNWAEKAFPSCPASRDQWGRGVSCEPSPVRRVADPGLANRS